MKKLFLTLIILLFASPLWGADQNIYLDNAGAGAGSEGDPYGAFSEINWTTGGANSIFDWVAAGDDVNINLKKGVTWREQLTIGTSGASGHPITIQAYSSGADPIILGSTNLTGWTQIANETWVTLGEYESDTATVDAGSTNTSIITGELTVTTANFYRGMYVVNVAGITGNALVTASSWGGATTTLTLGSGLSSVDENDTFKLTCRYTGVTEDCHIDQTLADTNANFASYLQFGAAGGGGERYRGLLRIDCSSIDSGYTVNDSELWFYQDGATDNTVTISFYQVWKTGWTETGATWNDWITPDSEWGTAGCNSTNDSGSENTTDGGGDDRKATAIGTVGSLAADGWVTPLQGANLDALVEDWIDGTYTDAAGIIGRNANLDDKFWYPNSSEKSTKKQRWFLKVNYNTGASIYYKVNAAWDGFSITVDSVAPIWETDLGAGVYKDYINKGTSPDDIDGAQQIAWDDATDTIYMRCSDDDDPDNHTIEACRVGAADGDYAIHIDGKNYVTIDGITARYTQRCPMFIDNSTYVTVKNCTFEHSIRNGVITIQDSDNCTIGGAKGDGNSVNYSRTVGIYIGYADGGSDENTVSYNTITYQWEDGVGISHIGAVNDGTIVEYNEISYSGEDGMDIDQSVNGIFRYNYMHHLGQDSYGYGIFFSDVGEGADFKDNAAYGNLIVDPNRHGIVVFNRNTDLYYNIINGYGSDGDGVGIFLDDNCQTGVVYGNIIIDNAATPAVRECILIGTGSSGLSIKNNILDRRRKNTVNSLVIEFAETDDIANCALSNNRIYIPGGGDSYRVEGVNQTLAEFQLTYSEETNTTSGDPLYTNFAGDDFTLAVGSPCISTGVDLGDTYDDALHYISSWPDSVLTLDQDDCGAGWEIGAYVYGVTETLGLGSLYKYNIKSTENTLYVPEGATSCRIENVTIDGTLVVYETTGNCYNIAVPGTVALADSKTLNCDNCYFAELEATIEANGGTVVGSDNEFGVTNFGFVDKAGGDFRIKRTSVLYQAGYDTGADEDLVGRPTPRGIHDVGAYEYYNRVVVVN